MEGTRNGRFLREPRNEHEDWSLGLPYPVVLDGVTAIIDTETGEEEIGIPDYHQYAAAVAMARVHIPLRFAGTEVRFLRKVLDLTQEEFGSLLNKMAKERVSRWENDRQSPGEATERNLRLYIIETLHERVPGIAPGRMAIHQMRVEGVAGDTNPWPLIKLRRVAVVDHHDDTETESWRDFREAA